MSRTQLHFLSGLDALDAPVTILGHGDFAAATPESLQVLMTLDDVRQATRRVAASAQRLISIFTPDLEPAVYEDPAFLDIIKHFILRYSFAKVRVLLHRPMRLIPTSNRLVAMARRLSSCLEFRALDPQFASRTSAMLIADTHAIMYRPQANTFEGVAGYCQPPIVRLHLQEFDAMWFVSPATY
jgi:hypothetical protein